MPTKNFVKAPAAKNRPDATRLQQGIALHRAGQLEQAQALYLQTLREQPCMFDALHLLGLIQLSRKQGERSMRLIRAALSIYPGSAVAHGNLGNALLDQKRYDDAIASYRQALALQPDYI